MFNMNSLNREQEIIINEIVAIIEKLIKSKKARQDQTLTSKFKALFEKFIMSKMDSWERQ